MSVQISRASLRIPGNEIDCFRFGTGRTPMVILPGLGVKSIMDSANGVAAAYRLFAEAFTVYCFDRPKRLHEGITLKEIAEDTAKAMAAAGIKNACIFGASQGGMMAQDIAARHPALAGALALGSTCARINPTFREVLDRWIAFAEQRNTEAFLSCFVDILYGKAYAEKYGSFIKMLLRDITAAEFERFLLLARACDGLDLRQELEQITCPVLVLGAENDRVLTAQGSVEIAEQIGCDCYLYGKEYGHCVFDEAPDYKRRLFDFFSRQGTAG